MYIQSSVLLLSAMSFLGVTLAAPAKQPTPAPLRLPLRRISNTIKRNAHLFHKRDDFLNALDTPLDGLNSTAGSAPLLNDIDLLQYGIQVQIGDPGQEFLLLFDTGSSDTWVPSRKCTEEKGCLSGRHYDPAASSNYQGDVDSVNITYGIGAATGHYFVDSLQVGDLSVPSQMLVKMDDNQGPIAQQNVGNQVDDSNSTVIDGIFAAGFPAGTMMAQTQNKPYLPFAMNLWENRMIPAPLFSLTMDPGSTTVNSSEWIGQVTFGAVDDTKHADAIQYTPVVQRNDGVYSHWMTTVKGFQYDNGTNTNFHFTAPTHFLIDSGSNFIYLPQGLSDQLASLVSQGTAQWDGATYTVDCALMDDQLVDSPPVLNVMFPQMENPNVTFPMSVPVSHLVAKNGPDQCVLLFVPSKGSNVFALGNLWLRNFVSVFDFGAYRMGFSPLFDTASSPSSLLSNSTP
ncbi:hypothetical protein [Absidia glauca]|uniref:Peptidase A1 domain-containing protein n=1 Tax=Absidia glauca TaxID=4829 RepID=A0A168N170_ABSGL|nr:hypothetical protein [Absidia glauca]